MAACLQNQICRAHANFHKANQIKVSAYKILKQNQGLLWKHFLIIMMKHVEFSFQSKNKEQDIEIQEIKSEIQSIFEWMSDPKIRDNKLRYEIQKLKWQKQVQEWENTFQKILSTQMQMKESFQIQLFKLQQQLEKVKSENKQLLGRNSVLESANKLLTQKIGKISINSHSQKFEDRTTKLITHKIIQHSQRKQIKPKLQLISSEISIKIGHNLSQYEIKSYNNIQKRETMQSQVMTCEILRFQTQQISNICDSQKVKIELKQGWSQTLNPHINKVYDLVKMQNIKIKGINKPLKEQGCQTQTQINTSKVYEERSVDYEERMNSNTDYQTQQQNLQQQHQFSCSSQSSYVIQFDRGTQTLQLQHKQYSCQTVQQKYSATTVLLMKIAHLQQSIEDNNTLIIQKQNKIMELQIALDRANKQVKQLHNDLAISGHIEANISQQYESLKNQYALLDQNYKNVFLAFNSYAETYKKQKQTTNNTEAQTQTQTHHNTQQQNEQQIKNNRDLILSTSQSQLLQLPSDMIDKTDVVDRGTIRRYLLQYIKLQTQNNNIQSKMSIMLTALQALNPTQNQEILIKQYINKMNINSQIGKEKESKKQQKLQQKLFHYLTLSQ